MKRKKSIFILLLSCVISIYATFFAAGCSNDEHRDVEPSQPNKPVIVVSTEEQAIAWTKESDVMLDEIIGTGYFKFYHIEWGTCTASYLRGDENYKGNWYVTLNGNISGYIDDYKTKFARKRFEATAHVYSDGKILNAYSTWK